MGLLGATYSETRTCWLGRLPSAVCSALSELVADEALLLLPRRVFAGPKALTAAWQSLTMVL